MIFEISQDNLEILSKSKKSIGKKPKSAISNENIQKELLIHIRDIEKKIKYLNSNTEKATLFYEIGLIWRDQIGDMRSAVVNFQKSYEADSCYLPNLKAVREIFIDKKNWDFVLDIIDTELSHIEDEDEALYLASLKSEILDDYRKDLELSEKILLESLKKNDKNLFFIIRKLKNLYFNNNLHSKYGKLVETLISNSNPKEIQEALLIDILTLFYQKKYKPQNEIDYYLTLLSDANGKVFIPNSNINWKFFANNLKEKIDKASSFNSDNLYLLYRLYKDILKDNSEANKILIANHQNIKTNFLLLEELEGHYASNYNWEKLIDIQIKKFSLLNTNEEKSNLYYKIGNVYLHKLDNIKKSKKYFKKSLEFLSDNISTIRILSKIAYTENDIDSLVDYHLMEINLTDNDSLNAILYFKIAEIFLKSKNYSSAENYYLKSIEQNSSYEPAIRAILKLYRVNKKWKEVISILNITIENSIDSDKKLSLKMEIGKIYLRRLHDFESATSTFSEILDSDGYSMDIVNYLDELYKRENLWTKLIELYEIKLKHIIDINEKINILTSISELCFNNFEEKNKALPYLKRILDLSPSHIPALQKISYIYKTSEDWDKVIDLNLNEIEFINSGQKKSILLEEIASIYKEKLKNLDKAIEYYELALEYNSNNFEAISELEYIYKDINFVEKLIHLFIDKRDDSESNNLKSIYSCKIAEYYINLDEDKAISEYWEALKYNNDNKIAFEELKNLYLKKNKIKKLIDLIIDYGDKDSAENNFYIGQLYYLYLDNFIASEKYLKKAIALTKTKEYYDFLIRLYFDNNKFAMVLELKDEYLQLLESKELYAFSKYIISFTEHNESINYLPIKEYIIIFNSNPKSHFFYKLFDLLYKAALWEDLLSLIKLRLEQKKNKREEVDLNYHIAVIYEYYKKNYEKALEYYENVILIDKNHFLALQGKRRLYKLSGNVSGIIEMLKKENYDGLSTEAKNEILYKNSVILIDKFKKYEDAEKLLIQILEGDNSDDRAFSKLYDLYLINNNHKGVIEIIDKKVDTINDLTYKEKLLIKKSEMILIVNPSNTQESIAVLKEIIKINPDNIKANMNLINFYFREQNYEKVIIIGERLASKNIGVNNYHKILYYLFKAYLKTKNIDRLLAISDMLLEQKSLSFDEMEKLLPIYQERKNIKQVLELILYLTEYDSEHKIEYILNYLELAKTEIDQERWQEKILFWLQITKSIELLNYYSKFFTDNSDYASAISILEENISSYSDNNIKSSIYKKIGDLKLKSNKTNAAINQYKEAIKLNGNLSAISKLRKIYSSDEKYIEEVLKYYPETIVGNFKNIFLIKDLFYIYKNLGKNLSVYNISTMINSLKLENKEAQNIYKDLKLKYPDKYNLYNSKNFDLIKSGDDNYRIRELFETAIYGMSKLTRKTVSSYADIEKITQKNNYKLWNSFNGIKTKLQFDNIELFLNKTKSESIDFIYPDNLAIIIPQSMLQLDQQQLSYFLSIEFDRIKSMNFLLNYHSIGSLIKFMKIIINYTHDDKIFNDNDLVDYYKLFSKGVSRATRKKLYSLKGSISDINWKDFDFKNFISSSYKTSLNIALIVSKDVNILLRAILKTRNLNNLTMTKEELIEELINSPELEETFGYLLDDRYIALLNSLDVRLVNKK